MRVPSFLTASVLKTQQAGLLPAYHASGDLVGVRAVDWSGCAHHVQSWKGRLSHIAWRAGAVLIWQPCS